MTLLTVVFIDFMNYDLTTVFHNSLTYKKNILSSLYFRLPGKCFVYALSVTEPKLPNY